MRQAPVFQGVGGGAAPRLEIGERLNGGLDAGGGDHAPL
jgi:hypothetical protein